MVGTADGWVGIQDSKEHPDRTLPTTRTTPRSQWATFLHAVEDNQLNP